MPPALLFLESKSASAAKDPIRAFGALEAFLKATPPEGGQYKEAIALYPRFQSAANEAQSLLNDKAAREQRATAEAYDKQASQAARAAVADLGQFIDVPAGTYLMGRPDSSKVRDYLAQESMPAHQVSIASFRMMKVPVTWQAGCRIWGGAQQSEPKKLGWGPGIVSIQEDRCEKMTEVFDNETLRPKFLAWLNQYPHGKLDCRPKQSGSMRCAPVQLATSSMALAFLVIPQRTM